MIAAMGSPMLTCNYNDGGGVKEGKFNSYYKNSDDKLFTGLNQAPINVMIENDRSGLIWGLFIRNKEVRVTRKKLKQSI